MIDFNFIVDSNYVAFWFLRRINTIEGKELELNDKLLKKHKKGYSKLKGKELLNIKIYIDYLKGSNLINELVSNENFKIFHKNKFSNMDEYELAISILMNTIRIEDSNINNLKNILWNKYNEDYKKLLWSMNENVEVYMEDHDVKGLIEEFKKTEIFNKLLEETKEYYEKIKYEWDSRKNEINKFLSTYLRINFNCFPNTYIVHPISHVGCNYEGKIIWGHTKGLNDIFYNLVYLVHESLHIILPPVFNRDDGEYINHAVIEMISDYELYSLLSKKDKFGEGHPFLREYKEKIYPFWQKYKESELKDLNIKQFEQYLFEEIFSIIK